MKTAPILNTNIRIITQPELLNKLRNCFELIQE